MAVSRAESKVVLYDAACPFCTRLARYADGRARGVRILPFDSEEGRRVLAAAGLPGAEPRSVALVDASGLQQRSEAVLRLAACLGGAWRFARVLRVLPRRWRDWAYDFVARRRFSFTCGGAGCGSRR